VAELEIVAGAEHINIMTKAPNISSQPRIVRDPHTGRTVEVYGLGGLKDKLTLREDIDLTQPIFEQVLKAPIDPMVSRPAKG
jgi:hypothetical protein